MKVLLATDFSEGAERAARVARRLAASPADLAIVHAFASANAMPASSASWIGMPAPPILLPAVELEPLRERLAAWSRQHGLEGERIVREGLPGRVVSEEARRFGADVVVLGASGTSGLERFLLGSSAHAILRAVDTSALVVRTGAETFRSIVIATDFSDPSREAARVATQLPGFADADLVVAHVRDESYEQPDVELAAFNREILGGKATEVLLEGNPVKALARLVDAEGADLAVIGNEGHAPWERALLGEIAGALTEKLPCDVLVGRPAHRAR